MYLATTNCYKPALFFFKFGSQMKRSIFSHLSLVSWPAIFMQHIKDTQYTHACARKHSVQLSVTCESGCLFQTHRTLQRSKQNISWKATFDVMAIEKILYVREYYGR
jgi:hypothetical protein